MKIQRPANERFSESLRAIIPDWSTCQEVAGVLGMTPEGVYGAVSRPPADGERGMTEAAFKQFANARGYDVVVVFVPREKKS